VNLGEAVSTVFATISGGCRRKACKPGVSSMPTLCNCGRRSPAQSCSKGSIQRRDIGLHSGGDPLSSRHNGGMSEGRSVVDDTHSTFQGGVLETRRSRSMPIPGAKAVSDRNLSWRGCGPSSPQRTTGPPRRNPVVSEWLKLTGPNLLGPKS